MTFAMKMTVLSSTAHTQRNLQTTKREIEEDIKMETHCIFMDIKC